MANSKFVKNLEAVCTDLKLPFSLKEEQVLATKFVCEGKHTFCNLPTGFGKSLIFGLVPLVKNKVNIVANIQLHKQVYHHTTEHHIHL